MAASRNLARRDAVDAHLPASFDRLDDRFDLRTALGVLCVVAALLLSLSGVRIARAGEAGAAEGSALSTMHGAADVPH